MNHPDITDDDLGKLVERVREATGALMQGDVGRYFALVNEAPDYTLMPPTGGPTRHGPTLACERRGTGGILRRRW